MNHLSKHSQKSIHRFISPRALEKIPISIRPDIVTLIERFVGKIANLTKAKNDSNRLKRQYKEKLVAYGLHNVSRVNINTKDPHSLLQRYQQIEKYVKERDSTVSDIYDLARKFAYRTYRQNPQLQQQITDELIKSFVRKHNVLIRELDDDAEYASRIFFNGLIHGWSNNDYDTFNRVV